MVLRCDGLGASAGGQAGGVQPRAVSPNGAAEGLLQALVSPTFVILECDRPGSTPWRHQRLKHR